MPDAPVAPAPLTVLDTHVWIWLVEGDQTALSGSAIDALERAASAGAVRVAAISVWEVGMLVAKRWITLGRPVDEWIHAALRAPGVRLLPLSPEIAIESTRLPAPLPADRADRMLIASARQLGGRLATCDRAILQYAQSGQVGVLDCRR
jgi:PIN domain nuclease of toxin-antitoxin system